MEEYPCRSLVDKTMDEEKEVRLSLEEAIEAIGFGRFQIMLTLGACILYTAETMELMANSVLAPILVCEWHLSGLEESMISTVVFIGMAIGSAAWGYLSDAYGRKKTLCLSALIVFAFGVTSSQVPSYWGMLICRWCVGFGVGGIPQTAAILTEISPIRQRSRSVIAMTAFGPLGALFASGLALAVVNSLGWHYYLLILSSPMLIFLIGCWWIPESPRYLLITKKMDKLNQVIAGIAKVNQKQIPGTVDLEVNVQSRGRVVDLFNEKLRSTTILLFVIWFTSAFSYYGIGLLTTQMFQSGINGCRTHMNIIKNSTNTSTGCRQLTRSDYTDLMKSTTLELPATLIVIFLVDKIGRKLCLAIQYGVGLMSIIVLFFCSSRTIMVVFISIFRAAVSSTYATLYLYTAEVYPTNVRSIGLGACSMTARFGSIITPFVAQVLIQKSFYSVVVVYAVLLLLSVFSSLLLTTETNQKPLEDLSANPSMKNYQSFQQHQD